MVSCTVRYNLKQMHPARLSVGPVNGVEPNSRFTDIDKRQRPPEGPIKPK